MTEYKPGDIISADMPLVHVLNYNKKNQYCDFCCFANENLKKCMECKHQYYCDKLCQKKDWKRHKYECAMYKQDYHLIHRNLDRFLLRLYLFVLNNPKSLDKKHQDKHERPGRCYTDLMTHRPEIENDNLKMSVFSTVISRFKKFDLKIEEYELFICFCKICINSFTIVNSEFNEIGSALYLNESRFDHSCSPNAAAVFNGSFLEIRAIKNISIDEKVLINYIDLKHNKKARQEKLLEQYYFECDCSRCQSNFDEGIDYDGLNEMITTMDNHICNKNYSSALELGIKTLPIFEKIYNGLNPDLTLQMIRVLKLYLYVYEGDCSPEALQLVCKIESSIVKTNGCNHEVYKAFKSLINNDDPYKYG